MRECVFTQRVCDVMYDAANTPAHVCTLHIRFFFFLVFFRFRLERSLNFSRRAPKVYTSKVDRAKMPIYMTKPIVVFLLETRFT